MSRRSVVLCGVPAERCSGSHYKTDQRLPAKAHGSHEQAFDCMKRHLLAQGFVQIGPRDFRPADGGPVRMLRKRTRYGERLRQGKLGERFMPEEDAGNRGVIIVT